MDQETNEPVVNDERESMVEAMEENPNLNRILVHLSGGQIQGVFADKAENLLVIIRDDDVDVDAEREDGKLFHANGDPTETYREYSDSVYPFSQLETPPFENWVAPEVEEKVDDPLAVRAIPSDIGIHKIRVNNSQDIIDLYSKTAAAHEDEDEDEDTESGFFVHPSDHQALLNQITEYPALIIAQVDYDYQALVFTAQLSVIQKKDLLG